MSETLSVKQIENYKDIANQLRLDCLEETCEAGSGHMTSCASIAEIMSLLFFGIMRFDHNNPKNPANDRFILSKGHAAPILYAAWAETGHFPKEKLLTLRQLNSDFEGHPTPRLDFVPVATGSLGNGLSNACGMAYTGKYFDQADYLVYCLLGDGEIAEGSVWEAANFASHYKLSNLIAIVDVNRLGQAGQTSIGRDTDTYLKRFEAFGWEAQQVDGHSIEEVHRVLLNARDLYKQRKDKPFVVLCNTIKGKGIKYTEDKNGFHGKAVENSKREQIMNDLINNFYSKDIKPIVQPPSFKIDEMPSILIKPPKLSAMPDYTIGQNVATRLAYGNALKKLGNNDPRIIVLDGDVNNSTRTDIFKESHPQRFIECFIAEQNMFGVAIGCDYLQRTIPFVSTFACFCTRAFDQLRMAAISKSNIKICGSHCGISIGQDGPSQMGLEDLALFRSLPNSIVFYPSDAVSTERAVELSANYKGISYIRTTRPDTKVIYPNNEEFVIGKCKILESSSNDVVTILSAGYTLFESLKAYKILKSQYGIIVKVIDLFSIKPLDHVNILKAVKDTNGLVITVEDHYPQGGIGEAVAGLLSRETGVVLEMLAVKSLPRSGKAEELVDLFGIGATAIVEQVLKMTRSVKGAQ